MAHTLQAKKRIRQNIRRNRRNSNDRSRLRTLIKRVRVAIDAGNHETALTEFRIASKYIDKKATKGLIHKNAAARYKSRLNVAIKALSA